MKIPEKPPDLQAIFNAHSQEVVALLTSPEGRKALSEVEEGYDHWEKAKYRTVPPAGVPPEVLWAAVKLSRSPGMRLLPLLGKDGRPFSYCLTDPALRELHELDFSCGGRIGLDTPGIPGEARERYLVSSLMEESIASSMIEGAVTTRRVAKEMLRTGRPPQSHGERMVLNNYRTIGIIKDHAKQPLSVDLLNRFHRSMTEGTLDDPSCAGRFRLPEEPIEVVNEAEGTVLHVPPASEDLPERMGRLCDFANRKETDGFIHPIVKAVILHLWLAYEHPYVDGNGRTARALFYWYALSQGYWMMEYLSISRIILRSRGQYLRSFLYVETDDLDATYFIHYHLRALRLAMADLRIFLERKQREYSETLKQLGGRADLNYRQQTLMQKALKHPDATFTFQSHKNSHRVAYGTAHADLEDLVRKGFLVAQKAGRTRVFRPPAGLVNLIKPNRG